MDTETDRPDVPWLKGFKTHSASGNKEFVDLVEKSSFCLRRSSDLINIANHFAAQAVELENRRPILYDWEKLEADWRLQQADTARRGARKFRKLGDKLMRKAKRIDDRLSR